ncbi:MAG: membrane protein insertase YidC, partial [Pseudomonadales bacterium]
ELGAVASQDDIPSLEVAEPSAAATLAATDPAQLVHVKTDVFDIQIDLRGGDLVRLALPAYPASLETPDIPFLLLDPRNAYMAQSGLIGPNGTDISGQRPTFRADRTSYDLGTNEALTVPLRFTQEDGTEIVKRFTFHRGDYLIQIAYEVTNRSPTDWRGGLFAQTKRNSQRPLSETNNVMGLQPYVGGATRSESEPYHKLEFDDLAEGSYKQPIADGYMALVQHYFVSAWVPDGGEQVNYSARKLSNQDIYIFGYTTGASVIPPGQTGAFTASYYAGPKDQYRLGELAEGLDLTVDYGFLWWLAQPLFVLLTWIHGVIPNWGVAIIGLTIVVKLLLYPLSAASFKSMAKMRKLQPEMLRLKERFGEDRQKFSQAMMDLYKKEGANPLGGCLPILLQMPVFLALYWTLMESVELRQAPFALWIRDLSAMDPYFVLPILMGVSMYLTQLMQPEPPDPVQAKVFKLMPIMFTFFFLWFPSGLVLYWLVNNILSILQQWYVTRQIDKAT